MAIVRTRSLGSTRLIASCAVLAILASATAARAGEGRRKLAVHSYPLNPYNRYLDGQWQGTIVASDGNCYFASSTHSFKVGSSFFRYDPEKKELKCLLRDIHKIGRDGIAQEKIHSDIEEANGWLYFASTKGRSASGRKGAHVMGYELATGKFRDFGVVRPDHEIYSGIGVDAKRNRLWVITIPRGQRGKPAELHWVDLASGKKTMLGTVSPSGASFYMFIDPKGNCWFTVRGSGGVLYRAAAADGKVQRFEKALPEGIDWWDWGQPLADGKRFAFLDGYKPAGKLWVFDPTKRIGTPDAFKAVGKAGLTHLGQGLHGNRVYIVQRDTARRWASGTSGRNDLVLRSIDAKSGKVIDHGLIIDQDGRYPYRIHAVSADGKGRVYMTGDWILLAGEKGSEKSMIRINKNILNRGQFFAVADVSKDLE